MPSILVPLHKELRRRLAQGSIPTLQTGFDGDGGGQYSSDAAKRISALHWKVRSLALNGVAQVTERTRDLPSITYMTHLQCSRWISWIELAAEECEPMDMTPLERYKMLDRWAFLFFLPPQYAMGKWVLGLEC